MWRHGLSPKTQWTKIMSKMNKPWRFMSMETLTDTNGTMFWFVARLIILFTNIFVNTRERTMKANRSKLIRMLALTATANNILVNTNDAPKETGINYNLYYHALLIMENTTTVKWGRTSIVHFNGWAICSDHCNNLNFFKLASYHKQYLGRSTIAPCQRQIRW